MDSAIIQIDDILVSSEIITEFFACDYDTCRGACCVYGDSGAPVAEDETEALERAFPAYAPLLTDAARARIAEVGFFEIDRDGDCVTPLLGNSEECVYTRFETIDASSGLSAPAGQKQPSASPSSADKPSAGVPAGKSCFCAIERAHMAGRCAFIKPISCRLYPIRASRLSNGLTALNLHRWDICRCAFEKGRRDGVRVYEFLRDPLTAAYGADFYEALCAAANELKKQSNK
ncbi:MAG: DUF3109 family protein [Bacteroidales bacterium]|nr:DUF3109 family protein [Bacteroidales bacterium]